MTRCQVLGGQVARWQDFRFQVGLRSAGLRGGLACIGFLASGCTSKRSPLHGPRLQGSELQGPEWRWSRSTRTQGSMVQGPGSRVKGSSAQGTGSSSPDRDPAIRIAIPLPVRSRSPSGAGRLSESLPAPGARPPATQPRSAQRASPVAGRPGGREAGRVVCSVQSGDVLTMRQHSRT